MKSVLLAACLLIFIIIFAASGCAPSPAGTSTPPSASTSTPESQDPISVVSVTGPLPPINPGGPNIEITLKNISNESIISLTSTLELKTSYDFNFDVSQAKPLSPDATASTRLTLINGSFNGNTSYPLQISGTFENGDPFANTAQVKIAEPASTTTSGTSGQSSATATPANGQSPE